MFDVAFETTIILEHVTVLLFACIKNLAKLTNWVKITKNIFALQNCTNYA